ncbi:MAG TPA: M12 family metallopeptidase, partial [Chitinophagaceae bacterium]
MMKRIFLLLIFFVLISAGLYAQKNIPEACGTPTGQFTEKNELDTINPRGMADNYYLWDPGATISVKFMPGGSQALRKEVMTYAREWEKYANIRFKFVPDNTPETDVRVQLTDNDGCWSMIGLQCHDKKQSEKTMNLDTIQFRQKTTAAYWRGTVIHEFGHALGLLHEQSYPNGIKWNKPAVYAYFLKNTNWDSAMIQAQILATSDVFYTNGTAYDPKSIMQYWVNKKFTIDSTEIPANTELSPGDKNIIAALYPNTGMRTKEVPRINTTEPNVTVIEDRSRKGVVIHPSFNLKSNSKLGTVYFIARLMDDKDHYIPARSQKYSLSGNVATFTLVTILPNSN